MRYLKRSAYVVVSIFTVLAINASSWAADEVLPDGLMLRLGGYRVQNASTIVRLDATNYPIGTYVDFSDTLGGESSTTVVRLDGLYRFNDKHAIAFSWYDIKFTGSRVLSQDINWGNIVFPKNAQVDSRLEYNVYKLNYQYSLYHDKKVELGVSAGLHIMRVDVDLNATGIGESKRTAITAPLPVIGLFADYSFTPRFSAYYSYQVFFINYEDKVKGGLQDFILGFEYRLLRNVAAGVAFNRFGLNTKIKDENTTLHADTNWNGIMLYGSVYF